MGGHMDYHLPLQETDITKGGLTHYNSTTDIPFWFGMLVIDIFISTITAARREETIEPCARQQHLL